MIELEPNGDRSGEMQANLEDKKTYSPNDFLLDTIRISTPKQVDTIFETFCKTITVSFWDYYKRIGIPRNIANNRASMLIADIAFELSPIEDDTEKEADFKRKAIHHLINARSRVLTNTRHMDREADRFADMILYIIGRVDEDESENKIVKFPVGRT